MGPGAAQRCSPCGPTQIDEAQLEGFTPEQARKFIDANAERLPAGDGWRETGFVFTTRIGTPLDARWVIRIFDRILKFAGLPKIRFHDLRHSAATLLLAQGVPARYVFGVFGPQQRVIHHADVCSRPKTDKT